MPFGMRGKKEYRVYYDNKRSEWVLESKSADRAIKVGKKKAPVVSKARSVAKNNDGRLRILNKTGGLVDERAYDA